MKKLTCILPPDHNLFLFGDDHEGTILRDTELWARLVEMILHTFEGCKNNFGIDHGDCCEAITVDDPRYDGITTQGLVLQQIERAVKNREAIKDRLIGICEGNHPLKLWRFGRITEHICKKIEVPYLTWSATIEYRNKARDLMYRHFCAHGFNAINSRLDDPVDRENTMRRALRRQLQGKSANCQLNSMGHSHRLLVYSPKPPIDPVSGVGLPITAGNAAFIPPYHRYYVNTGSFYKSTGDGFSGYAEIKGYDPMPTGFAVAIVRGGVIQEVREIYG